MSGSEYTVTITGPRGVALVMVMDATLRRVVSLAIDDEVAQPMLVVSSVLAGQVEGTLEVWRREAERAARLRAADAELVSQRVAAGEYPAERKGVAA